MAYTYLITGATSDVGRALIAYWMGEPHWSIIPSPT